MNTSKPNFLNKLSTYYRVVILRDSNLEEKLSFKVSRLNVYLLSCLVTALIAGLSFVLIAVTPLKEYIPGYQDTYTRKAVVDLAYRADSLELILGQQNTFIGNIQRVLSGETIDSLDNQALIDQQYGDVNYDSISLNRISPQDSILRKRMENEEYYALLEGSNNDQATSLSEINFHLPVQGLVTGEFDPEEEHFGIDIVGKEKQPIKAILAGVVIFQEWTLDTGYVLAIQHDYNLVSFYKHNSVLLKQIGNTVAAGDAIAIIGDSGHKTTGPHLHFEMWHERKPINPLDYLTY